MNSAKFDIKEAEFRMQFVVIILVTCLNYAFAQNSPCPDIFSYQIDRSTNAYFGQVELRDLQVGQTVKLNINLSLPSKLPTSYVGSIDLVGTKQSVFNDVSAGKPVRYKVNFPIQNLAPNVVDIQVNGQSICRGPPAQGLYVTTIRLDHTLVTYLENQGGNGGQINQYEPNYNNQPQRPFVSNTVYQTERPYVPPQPQTTRATQRPYVQRPTQPSVNAGNNEITCGQQNSVIVPLLFNGTPTRKGQWPWLTAIYHKEKNAKTEFICGSTLISNHLVITAAHCLVNEQTKKSIPPSTLLASLGRYNIDDFAEDNTLFENVENAIAHPEYGAKENSYDADIGILILKRYVTFTMYIKPICLWSETTELEAIVGTAGSVTGWGLTEKGVLSSQALTTKLSVVSRDACVRQDNLFLLSTSERTFCAGGEGAGPCSGDSGSGFVINRNGKWMLRGVVSHSLTDPNTLKCDVNKYAVYTDVSKFSSWITSYM